MPPPVPRLTISPYLQGWDPTTSRLSVSVLLAPTGDPRQPLGPAGAPAFAASSIVLQPRYPGDPNVLPTVADVAATGAAVPLNMPASQAPIFDALAASFNLTLAEPGFQRSAATTLRKYLPVSYRRSFAFAAPRTPLAVIDDSYHCAVGCPPKSFPGLTPPTDQMSWGEAFAVLLRQPVAARAAGLVHDLTLDVGANFAGGGWLFFVLDAASSFAIEATGDPGYLRLYATRVPRLVPNGSPRTVFTPVLFPLYADASSIPAGPPLDPVFAEAIAYDDGFAKIVHARQPQTTDVIAEDDVPGIPPPREVGVQLAWDDEDVLVSQNRTVGLEADGSTPPDAPRAVSGYRIDAREVGGSWTSLCRVRGVGVGIDGTTLPSFETELNVEIHPTRVTTQFWLPPYFARWRGSSLVVNSPDQQILAGRPSAASNPYSALDADAVELRYGHSYELRVRLSDPTGGGPGVDDAPSNPAAAPVARLTVRRYVAPAALRVGTPTGTPLTGVQVKRPLLGWPAAELAGIPNATSRLATMVRAVVAGTSTAEVGLPDPDVPDVEITVLVRMPEFDPAAGPGGWTELYTAQRRFPANPASSLHLSLTWQDCAHLSDIAWPTTSGALMVPTARDVRIELRALGRDDAGYFGNDTVRRGPATFLGSEVLHVPAAAEGTVFAPTEASDALATLLLQPNAPNKASTVVASAQGPDTAPLPQRLAAAVELSVDDATLFGPPGRRTIFTCTGLQHRLAPDASSLALTATDELAGRWISVLRLRIDRDWSWLGSAAPAFRLERRIQAVPGGVVATTDLGPITPMHAVNRQATLGEPDRDSFDLVMVDAFPPPLNAGRPTEAQVAYTITANLQDGSTQAFDVANHLPTATPPTQRPVIVSAGHAFGEYRITGDYAATEPRDRGLWIELAEPLADARDALFCRVLWVAPDPLLMPGAEPLADPSDPAPPAIIPTPVRIVRPGQPVDFAGLSAMQRLQAAEGTGNRHFLVPLPPNARAESPELFGFYTYEFAVGHDRGAPSAPFWSTAEARFGPGLVLAGVQHPPPRLVADPVRRSPGVHVSAEPARAYYQGRRRSWRPRTQIWMVLYARVRQADGRSTRNLQIDARRAVSLPGLLSIGSTRIEATWSDSELAFLLQRVGLPAATPLSMLAVEVLPEPNGSFFDPVGSDLGQVRIMRTSPLTEIPATCCL